VARSANGPRLPTPAELRALARRDPVLGAAARRLDPYPGFPRGEAARGTHYEALVRAIVYQQLSGKAAGTIHRRACALTPGKRFPGPPELPGLPDEALRGAGLSRAKVAAVRDLAGRIESGALKLRSIGRCEDERVIEQLVEVRGIGVWSARMFLMFRLGRLDVMPIGDLGVQEGLRLLDGLTERPTPRELLARSEPWAPLCSVAAWTLWRVVEEHRAS